MAIDLTTIFGNEIIVPIQPRLSDKQYVAFPGAHGLVGMNLGFRSRQIIIKGRLRAEGANYNAARSSLQSAIDAIEDYLNLDAASYTYKGDTYDYIVFDRFQIIPGAEGKTYFWDGSECICDFIMYARQLI